MFVLLPSRDSSVNQASFDSGTCNGNEDTQNNKYWREENGLTPNEEITLQIVLQVECGAAIQRSTKVTHVLR